ncbi:MAG TPA: amidase family protein, partial [Usitatibacter sp.]|nr:amidase family protein [Usitatibacter sp.]
MNRRLRAIAAAFLLAAGAEAMAATREEVAFDVAEKSVAQLQEAMAAGRVTSREITRQYLERIETLDKAGPRLNSVIELNPDALEIAAGLDRERKEKGPRGPLHGIPVLIKDNLATADAMQTTAGSLALVGAKPPRDAFVVAKLRQAGAVILGKTNLSEWANIRSTRSTSGWSSRGGLSRNPYALDRNTSGSSSGSGAAAAASLAAVTVGTETDGSITSPSSINGLVGIKPTVGLLSRAGIIPISPSQDTPGPMTRGVADAAVLLTAMAGSDPRDPATAEANAHATDYTTFLDPGALKGARIGVVKKQFHDDPVSAEVARAIEVMRSRGAIVV